MLVPDIVDYSNDNGIIDFEKDIDEQLFALAGLNDEEISYVKNVIDNLR